MLPRPKRNAVERERAEKEVEMKNASLFMPDYLHNKWIPLNLNQNQDPMSCHGRITNSSLFMPDSAHGIIKRRRDQKWDRNSERGREKSKINKIMTHHGKRHSRLTAWNM
eukprot:scaffold192692_cov29-Attheya_sp.AAC.1